MLKTMVYVWFTESKHRVSNPVPLSHGSGHSRYSEFKSIKTKAITGAYNYTKKGMEKGTTYYFKVRSYKVVDERKCGVSTVKLFLYIDILHSDKGGA
jgi:hypothetical protein